MLSSVTILVRAMHSVYRTYWVDFIGTYEGTAIIFPINHVVIRAKIGSGDTL